MRALLTLLIALAVLWPAPADSRHHEPHEPAEPAEEAPEAEPEEEAEEKEEEEDKGPFKPFDEVTEDCEHLEGYFDLYQKPGTLLLAVRPDQLETEFLMNFEIARGIGARGLNGGTMLNIFAGSLMSLERHGDKIYLVEHPHQMRSDSDADSWDEVMEISFDTSIVAVADIESQREDEALLINIHDWLVSDISGVSRWVKFAVSTTPGKPGSASLDSKRSYMESVKAFPENVNFKTKLTFSLSEPPPFNSLANWKSLPLTIHAAIVKLPEKPMKPRLADDRMGYFLTVYKDFSRDEETFFTRYCNRWRLEKGKKRGKLHEPEEPITYYLDRTIPKKYRNMIKDSVLQWNKAFEAAGWKNAVRAEMLPKDADAEDIRYPTIRWMATDQESYLAIGPSVVDPRSGEILDADILIDTSFAMRTSKEWERVVDPATIVDQLFAEDPYQVQNGYRCESANFRTHLALEANLVHADLVARGRIRPGEPMPDEFVEQFMAWLVMHEVGHTLGLRHNFQASTDTPNDRLHDVAWTEEMGLVSSVMDYSTANLAPAGTKNGQYYGTTVGTSDLWVISYGYTASDDRAAEIARQGSVAGHAYGSDEDRNGPGALDPTVNAWDLGGDPLAWSKNQTTIINDLLPGLADRVLVDNAPYADVTATVQHLLGSYAVSLSPAVKYIGGSYVYRNHAGDAAGKKPFVPVEKQTQREALNHLIRNCFSASAFTLSTDLMDSMGPNRWVHWGNRFSFSGRVDYPYHEQVLRVQESYLRQVLHPFRLARMSDAEIKYGAGKVLTIPELMDSLRDAVFTELNRSQSPIPSMRRNLQRSYVEQLTALVTESGGRTPDDARAMARLSLKELASQIGKVLESGAVADRATEAHLTELGDRVRMALEASMSIPVKG